MHNNPLAAAGVVLAAMAVIGVIDQYVQALAEQSSLWTFHLIRSAMIWLMVGAWLAITRRGLHVVSWSGVLGRSAIISTAMIIYFGALGFLPVAQVAAGLFTAPIWVLVFSVAFFGLRIGPVRIAAVAAGFTGAILVLSPDVSAMTPLLFLPAVAGAFYAVGAIATREWCGRESTLVLSIGVFSCMAVWGLAGVLALGVFGVEGVDFLTRGFIWPTAQVLWICALQAAGSLVSVLLLTRGYQMAEASHVSIFEFSLLLFSALFGWLLRGDTMGPVGLMGLVLIAAAGSLIALRKERGAAI